MSDTRLDRLEVTVFRVPVEIPVMTSFGTMTNRPAVFVRLSDQEGAFGWGEIFANWPAAGAEHRARLLIEDIADLVIGYRCETPSDLFHYLSKKTRIRAMQCGEPGPFRQVIAGLDTACHDLFARRAGVPLSRYLNPDARAAVPAYASGIHVNDGWKIIPKCRAQGYDAFKVKIGFDGTGEIDQLRALIRDLGAGETLYTDANQAWTMAEAMQFVNQVNGFGLGWIEEPMPADALTSDWAELARVSTTPIAAGENITGFDGFGDAIRLGSFTYLQPDVAKWGGVTGCFSVARQALDAGQVYCPHFLGGGIGLIASAHILAAAGGVGSLEIDFNTNPLRDAFLAPSTIGTGRYHIPDTPGLGFDSLPEEIGQYQTLALQLCEIG